MKPRSEAVKFIHRQFAENERPYGRQQLRDLMDFIYESQPQGDNELINIKGSLEQRFEYTDRQNMIYEKVLKCTMPLANAGGEEWKKLHDEYMQWMADHDVTEEERKQAEQRYWE